MIKRVETNLYKREAIKEDINNAVGIAESADATAGTALSRATYEYGVCTDSSDTQNKVVVIENFPELYVGATCTVTFRYRNTAQSPTLNVNGTGAKTIYARGSGLSARSGYNWENGAVLRFIYDGTYWVMMPQSMQEAVNVLAGSNENSQTQIMYVEQGRVYINADYITTGSLDASIIATTELNASNIVTGTLDAERLTVINLLADSITGGTLDFDDIAVRNLTATDIVGGTLNLGGATNGEIVVKDAQNRTIATLDTNGLTLSKGVIDANKVEVKNIDAEKITAGTLSVDRIPNLDADKITTGYLDAARIQADSIDVSKLGGEISNGQWKLDFEKETFTIGTITADKIHGGTLKVGGVNNAEGVIEIQNGGGNTIYTISNEGIKMGISPKITMDILGFFSHLTEGSITSGGKRYDSYYGIKADGGKIKIGTWSSFYSGGWNGIYFDNRTIYLDDGTEYTSDTAIGAHSLAQGALDKANSAQTTASSALTYARAYKSDVFSFSNLLCAGSLTGQKAEVHFFVPTFKDLGGRTTASVTTRPTKTHVRTANGDLVSLNYGGSNSPRITKFEVTGVSIAGFYVKATLNTAISSGSTNNSPVSVSFDGTIGITLG